MPTEVRSCPWKLHVAVLCLQLLLSLLCAPRLAAQAPPFSQAFVAGGGAVRVIALDSGGNIVVGGSALSPSPSFLRRYTPSGNLTREANAPAFVSRLVLDRAGRSYLIGRTQVRFDDGSCRGVASRYDAQGGLDWSIMPDSLYNTFLGVALDSAGEINVVGNSSSDFSFAGQSVQGYNAYGFLTHIGSFGGVSNLRPFGGYPSAAPKDARTECLEIASNGRGGFLLCGAIHGSVVIGDVPVTSPYEGEQLFVAELDRNGVGKWVRLLQPSYFSALRAYFSPPDVAPEATVLPKVRVDAQQNIYVSAMGDSSQTGYLAKLNSQGTVLWAKTIPALLSGLILDGVGDIYCAGSFSSSLTVGSTNLTSAGGTDIFVLKFRNDGQLIWAKRAGGPSDDQCNDLTLDAAGNPVLAGYFITSTRFDTFSLSSGNTAVASFVARLGTNSVPLFPVIQSQPVSQSVGPGDTGTFVVVATGAPPLTYQWRFNGNPLSGATNAILSIPNALLANSGNYDVIVSNAAGTTNSVSVSLTVVPGSPSFADDFQRRGILIGFTNFVTGNNTLFTEEAAEPDHAGRKGLHSAWLTWTAPDNGSCLIDTFGSSFDTVVAVYTGTNLASLLPVVSNDDASKVILQSQVAFQATAGVPYQIAVDGYGPNDVGNILFHLSFSNAAPYVLIQPSSQQVLLGSNAVFSVGALGVAPLRYQWRFNETNIAGATQALYSVQAVQPIHAGDYSVSVANSFGSVTSGVARLTVLEPPRITRVTGNTRPIAGTTSTLVVEAAGSEPLSYEWHFNGLRIAGEFQSTLTLPSILPTQAGPYRAVVTNPYGSVTSAPVQLVVTYTLSVSVDSGGTVSRTPDQTSYNPGTSVELLATPSSGAFFAGWAGDATGTANPLRVSLTTNRFVTARFASVSLQLLTAGPGRIVVDPEQAKYSLGDRITLSAIPARWHRFERWDDGLLTATRQIIVAISNRYTAFFTPTQALETITVGDVSRVAPVGTPSMRVDGEFITNSHVSRLDRAWVEFGTTLPRATVLYTLDGRQPNFLSTLYQGPFQLTSNAVVRAVAFDESLTLARESDPVDVQIIPAQSVLVRSAGGGDVVATPPGNTGLLGRRVPSGTVVTLNAIPWDGWHFNQWLGDLGGTNSPSSVLMNEGKDILATFGTAVTAVGAGNGIMTLSPEGGDYEYGTTLRVNAIPAPESYFAFWAGGLGDVVNPLSLVVTNASLRPFAVFQPLPQGEVSLSIASDGPGVASVKPVGNRFKLGQRVAIKAVPDSGATFEGWSLESLGTESSVSLTLDKSYALTARFRRVPVLRLGGGAFPDRDGMVPIELLGDPGTTYVIETATDLRGPWTYWAEQVAMWGRIRLSVDIKPEAGTRYFRVR